VGYATPEEIAADFLFEARGNVAEASFYLSARRVREGVKDRVHNGDEGRELALIPDHRTGRIARSSGLP
jgi:hypothetical protein